MLVDIGTNFKMGSRVPIIATHIKLDSGMNIYTVPKINTPSIPKGTELSLSNKINDFRFG